jgi:TRAP-type C4-dicarboxylate transport system substrate-binding protein
MLAVFIMGALLIGGLLLVGASLGTRAAGAQQRVTWKVALYGPPRAATVPLEWYAKQVASKTGGQLKIELVYGEALAKATEMPDGIKAGAFEMALLCASYYPGKLPLFTVLDLPMLTPADVVAQGRVQMAVGDHPAIAQELKRWNARLLVPAPLPQYQIMGQRRLVKAEDFKGVRIRVSGEMAHVLEDYGAVKSLVPAPEVFPSLERGVVDAATFPGTYAFASYRLHEISKYYIDKISLGSQPCFFAVSQTAWGQLPPPHQKLLLDLREPTLAEFVRAYRAADEKNYVEFRRKGIEVIDFPASERARLVAGADKHWRAWVEDKERRGLPGRALFEFVRARIEEYSPR